MLRNSIFGVWGDRESGRIFKLFVYVGKVTDHLSVTFYFGFSDKEYLKSSFSVSPATREMPYLSLQK